MGEVYSGMLVIASILYYSQCLCFGNADFDESGFEVENML